MGGGFQMEGYWVWGSSVAKGDDGLFHMFVSRWPKRLPFHPGWMVASEIVHATSKTAEGPYRFSEVVLPARGPQYWDGRSTHNPKIVRHGKTWILFYMGSTHPFADVDKPETLTLDSPYAVIGRSSKRIGVATASSPFGPWTRRDAPVLPTRPGTFYSFLTSNPAPFIDKDGSVLLLFKGRGHGPKFPYQTPMSIGVARAPHFLGPYTVVSDKPIFSLDTIGEIEDPVLWKDGDGVSHAGQGPARRHHRRKTRRPDRPFQRRHRPGRWTRRRSPTPSAWSGPTAKPRRWASWSGPSCCSRTASPRTCSSPPWTARAASSTARSPGTWWCGSSRGGNRARGPTAPPLPGPAAATSGLLSHLVPPRNLQ